MNTLRLQVDDTLKTQMNNFLLSTANQQEIQGLDAKIHETVSYTLLLCYCDADELLVAEHRQPAEAILIILACFVELRLRTGDPRGVKTGESLYGNFVTKNGDFG